MTSAHASETDVEALTNASRTSATNLTRATSSTANSSTASSSATPGLFQLATLITGGLGLWMTVITLNNITDFGTNRALIAKMLTMSDLVSDPVRGNGLEWRAMPAGWAVPALIGVIAFELVICALMWRAFGQLIRHQRGHIDGAAAIRACNQGLLAFCGLFLLFFIGGMWFAYWIYLGAAQQVHFTGLMLGMLLALLVNMAAIGQRITR